MGLVAVLAAAAPVVAVGAVNAAAAAVVAAVADAAPAVAAAVVAAAATAAVVAADVAAVAVALALHSPQGAVPFSPPPSHRLLGNFPREPVGKPFTFCMAAYLIAELRNLVPGQVKVRMRKYQKLPLNCCAQLRTRGCWHWRLCWDTLLQGGAV